MNTSPDLERALRATLEGLADRTVVDGQLDAILDHVAHRRQRPAWRATLRSSSMTAKTIGFPRVAVSPAWKMLAVAGLILALILATLLAVGGRPFGPPVNGRIVFGRFDPAQNDTVLYTVNPDGSHLLQLRPETHECPQWSPDGKRITTTDTMMNGDGTGFRPFLSLTGPLYVGCGVWSADQKNDRGPRRATTAIRARMASGRCAALTAAASINSRPRRMGDTTSRSASRRTEARSHSRGRRPHRAARAFSLPTPTERTPTRSVTCGSTRVTGPQTAGRSLSRAAAGCTRSTSRRERRRPSSWPRSE